MSLETVVSISEAGYLNDNLIRISKTVRDVLNLKRYDLRKEAEVYTLYKKINPITMENLFRGVMFYVLSPVQRFDQHINLFKALQEYELLTPEAVLDESKKFELLRVLYNASFNKDKINHVKELSNWWLNSGVPEGIKSGIINLVRFGL
jgi:hypothetical protein